MARKKVKKIERLRTWDDVNEGLRKIWEMKSAIDAQTGAYNEEEAKRRKQLDDFCNPLRERIEQIELGLSEFCTEHRIDFGDKKSKELPNGRVDFRMTTPKCSTFNGWTWKAVIDVIRNSDFAKRFLKLTEAVNKEQIIADYAAQQISDDELAKIYLKVEQEETFGYEVYSIKQKEAA